MGPHREVTPSITYITTRLYVQCSYLVSHHDTTFFLLKHYTFLRLNLTFTKSNIPYPVVKFMYQSYNAVLINYLASEVQTKIAVFKPTNQRFLVVYHLN